MVGSHGLRDGSAGWLVPAAATASMKAMPAHRARMADAGSALVVSGRRQNRMEPWLARDGRADQDGQGPRQRGLGQGEPRRAQEAPYDPIPLRGRHEVALFLIRSPRFSRDRCGLLLVKTRFEHGDSAHSSFSFTYSYNACKTFAISLVRENVFIA